MHSCTHWLRPRNFPLPSHLDSYPRALLVSQDRRHLFVTPWWKEERSIGQENWCKVDGMNAIRILLRGDVRQHPAPGGQKTVHKTVFFPHCVTIDHFQTWHAREMDSPLCLGKRVLAPFPPPQNKVNGIFRALTSWKWVTMLLLHTYILQN